MSQKKNDKELLEDYIRSLKDEMDFVEGEITQLLTKINSMADEETEKYREDLTKAVGLSDKEKIKEIVRKINSI